MVQQYRKDTSVNSISGPDKANYQATPQRDVAGEVDSLIRYASQGYNIYDDAKVKADTQVQLDLANRQMPVSSNATIEGKRVHAQTASKSAANTAGLEMKAFADTNPTEEAYQQRLHETTENFYAGNSEAYGSAYADDPELRNAVSTNFNQQMESVSLYRQSKVMQTVIGEREETLKDALILDPASGVQQLGKMQLSPQQEEAQFINALSNAAPEQQAQLIELSKTLNFGGEASLYDSNAQLRSIETKRNKEELLGSGVIGMNAAQAAQDTINQRLEEGVPPDLIRKELSNVADGYYKQYGQKIPRLESLNNSIKPPAKVEAQVLAESGVFEWLATGTIPETGQPSAKAVKGVANKVWTDGTKAMANNPEAAPAISKAMVSQAQNIYSTTGQPTPQLTSTLHKLVNDPLQAVDGKLVLSAANETALSFLTQMSDVQIQQQLDGNVENMALDIKAAIVAGGPPAETINNVQSDYANPKPVKFDGFGDAVTKSISDLIGYADDPVTQSGYMNREMLNSFTGQDRTSDEASKRAVNRFNKSHTAIGIPEFGFDEAFYMKGNLPTILQETGLSNVDDVAEGLQLLNATPEIQSQIKALGEQGYDTDKIYLNRTDDGFLRLYTDSDGWPHGPKIEMSRIREVALKKREKKFIKAKAKEDAKVDVYYEPFKFIGG